jgi:hypothetical protein
MWQEVVGTGCEWKVERGVKEAADELTAVLLAVTSNVGDERSCCKWESRDD